MAELGKRIADRGWRQGSVLQCDDSGLLGECYAEGRPAGAVIGLVVSQSCDLTHERLEGEPFVEILVGCRAEDDAALKLRGNCTGGKHPRCLHVPIRHGRDQVWFQFLPWDRVVIDRGALVEILPDDERVILHADLDMLVNWLAQRYVRAAFPDDFNNLLDTARNKQKKLHARLSPDVSGLYARLNPDRDLLEGERYALDLLALVPGFRGGELSSVSKTVEALVDLIRSAGIDARGTVKLEDEVSYGFVRSFRRFPLEHLSLRGDPPDPMPFELSASELR
ncbi:hypothetical protein ebA5940 [Aromatoleum aromaticum EbN1]|uniref:Uncharacterized protein n=1 Tax=Aromatoleum aromaticum (strain DSM 19018 / LMG 30748 / EbN1) TaxID=76114 RepID=Q5NZK9_AROAE|nr:hypothetical protein ebA5940 [Aromatoleum aromaticum EbN1]